MSDCSCWSLFAPDVLGVKLWAVGRFRLSLTGLFTLIPSKIYLSTPHPGCSVFDYCLGISGLSIHN